MKEFSKFNKIVVLCFLHLFPQTVFYMKNNDFFSYDSNYFYQFHGSSLLCSMDWRAGMDRMRGGVSIAIIVSLDWHQIVIDRILRLN